MNAVFITGSHALAALLVFCSGCVSFERGYPDQHYFVIEVKRNVNPPTTSGNGVVEVAEVLISPRYTEKSFVYRTSEARYESDFYNQFFRPPGAMLTEVAGRWLNDAGLFQEVFGSVTQADANYFIEGNVIRLYGDFRSSPKAVMEIQFLLLKYTTDSSYDDNTKIVLGKNYSSEIPIASTAAGDLMQGWNTALGEILNAFLADLKNNVN